MLISEPTRRELFRQSGRFVVGCGVLGLVDRSSAAADAEIATRPNETIAPPRLNDARLKAIDLREPIKLGVEHICHGAVDRRRGCLPLGQFKLTDAPPSAQHIYWESPHMVGRFLDALAVSAPIISTPADDEVVEGLRLALFKSLEHPSGFAVNGQPDPSGHTTALMHNCREVLLGLTGLIVWKQCDQSRSLATRFVRTMEAATRETGTFPTGVLGDQGWQKDAEDKFPCVSSGRAIGALVKYYRATQDEAALDLAIRFADHNIPRAFTPEGTLTAEAGFHLHSINGTITGILDLGRLTNKPQYLEVGKRVYDVGLKPWRTSFGWARERRDDQPGRGDPKGEANNTGDLIQSALLLGQSGYRKYFDDAERFIRNGLLASQIVNTDWIAAPDGTPDTDEIIYSDIRKRIRGAFTFTTPNAFQSYNTDLMGGSIQSLCDAWRAILSQDKTGWHINLLFSCQCDSFDFRSFLPEEGRLEIVMSRAAQVAVRLPLAIPRSSLSARINGKGMTPKYSHGEIVFSDLGPKDRVEVTFEQPRKTVTERVAGYGSPFEVVWVGDTVADATPRGHLTRLY